MSNNKRGFKLGWIGGGLGSLLWIPVLSVMFLFRDHLLTGTGGILLFLAGFIYLFLMAPWRHPDRSVGLLYTGFALILVAAVAWTVLRETPEGLNLSHLPILSGIFPLFLPAFLLWKKTWNRLLLPDHEGP